MTSWRLGNKPSLYRSGHCGVWLPLSPLSAPREVIRRRLFARRLNYVRCRLLLKPAVLPGLQHLLPQPWPRFRKGAPNRERKRLSHGENEGHAIKEDGRRETLVHRCHPLSTLPTLSALSTVEALLTPSRCSKDGVLAPKFSTKVCLPQPCRLLRIGGDEPASRAPISAGQSYYQECRT